MARFQAQTNNVLEAELEYLRQQMGLRDNQKADLLREITTLAVWVLRQAQEGRSIQAHDATGVQTLEHPILERLRQHSNEQDRADHILKLSEEETQRLVYVLERGFSPTPALQESLLRIANTNRTPPILQWNEARK